MCLCTIHEPQSFQPINSFSAFTREDSHYCHHFYRVDIHKCTIKSKRNNSELPHNLHTGSMTTLLKTHLILWPRIIMDFNQMDNKKELNTFISNSPPNQIYHQEGKELMHLSLSLSLSLSLLIIRCIYNPCHQFSLHL
jgi:hypothetical protein